MHFLALTAAAAAAALAAPAPVLQARSTAETVTITDYTLRKTNGTVQSVQFHLSGDNATFVLCSLDKVDRIPSQVVPCGTSYYRFGLAADPSPSAGPSGSQNQEDPFLAVYHELGTAFGRYAIVQGPSTYCHVEGDGPDDYVCSQTEPKSIIITS